MKSHTIKRKRCGGDYHAQQSPFICDEWILVLDKLILKFKKYIYFIAGSLRVSLLITYGGT